MKKLITILFVALMLLSFSCANQPPPQPPTPSPSSSPSPTSPPVKPPVKPTSEPEKLPEYPLTIVDDLGREIVIDQLPERIISLAPSNTEILYELGLEDRIIGVTDFCDYPERAKSKPRVASFTSPDIEKLVSLQPDLILASSIHEKEVLPALERLEFTVFVTSAESVDTVLHDITVIGNMNDRANKAAEIVEGLKDRITGISEKTAGLSQGQRPKVLYIMWHSPIWSMGANTFTDDMISIAGGTNIFSDDFEKSRVVSLESVITKNPDVIIVSGMGSTASTIYDAILREERLKTVNALANKRLYKISDSNLIERPGPRIVDGLEEIARLINPSLFN